MLINSIELLKQARKENRCVPAFNVYNLETIQAAFAASARAEKPVIIAFGESNLKNTSLSVVAAIVKTMACEHPYPVVLHLDHCKSIDTIKAAIEVGFTSVMYDGSQLSLKANIANTIAVAKYAHARNVSVEGELGCMNPEDGSEDPSCSKTSAFTDVHQAQRYVWETGVDSLAVAVGNAHGLYKGVPNLDMMRLQEIYSYVNIPIVLHGCSGISKNQLREAVSIAVAKINVNTEISLAGSNQVFKLLQGAENVRFDKLMLGAQESMTQVMEYFLGVMT
ncbi:class II fructose-bisphosphate aldolase [Oscillospiraceae bacterium PP1C4]